MSQVPPLPQGPGPSAEAKDSEEKFVDSLMYCITAPVIVWPGWEDSFKDKWSQVLLHRLAHAKEVFAQRECTEFEAMLYVSSVSLAQPLSHTWREVYFWLFRRWNPTVAEEIDMQTKELDPQEKEDLVRLRRWIFERQVLHLREKQQKASHAEVQQEQKKVEAERPRLF